jgi:hypothetical protein
VYIDDRLDQIGDLVGSFRAMPRSEPEIMRKKGRLHAAWCNERVRKPYAKGIYIALELAEQAYEAHGLPL